MRPFPTHDMKRNLLVAASLLVALIVAYAGVWAYKHKHRERLFYEQAFNQMRAGGDAIPMITIDLDDGGSAKVILEHSCCSGAGFDAVAVRTSDGKEYRSNKNYCGLMGFDFSVHGDAMKDMAHFKAFIKAEGYKPR